VAAYDAARIKSFRQSLIMPAPPMPSKPQLKDPHDGEHREQGRPLVLGCTVSGVLLLLLMLSIAILRRSLGGMLASAGGILAGIGPLLFIVCLIFGGGVLHYLVWGWWLGAYLRDKYNIDEDEL